MKTENECRGNECILQGKSRKGLEEFISLAHKIGFNKREIERMERLYFSMNQEAKK